MSIILNEKIQGRSAWKGIDLAKDDSWIYYLSEKTIAALEKAVVTCSTKGNERHLILTWRTSRFLILPMK